MYPPDLTRGSPYSPPYTRMQACASSGNLQSSMQPRMPGQSGVEQAAYNPYYGQVKFERKAQGLPMYSEGKDGRRNKRLSFISGVLITSLAVACGFFLVRQGYVGKFLLRTEVHSEPLAKQATADTLTGPTPFSAGLHGTLGVIGGVKLWNPDVNLKELTGEALNAHLSRFGGMNRNLSDHTPLDRPFPYNFAKPASCPTSVGRAKVSVIIPVCEEGPSFLLRTLHSVFNRTPPALLHEVVLVDDFSSDPWFFDESIGLRAYLRTLPEKVTVVRSSRRQGIAQTKLLGAKHSSGDYLVFVDSHVEFGDRWLEPLVARLRVEHTAVVFPESVMLSPVTLEPNTSFLRSPVGFQWKLLEQAIPQALQQRFPTTKRGAQEKDPNYIGTPVLPAGMFAVERRFFMETLDGGFDSKMPGSIGMDNLELSLRTWQLGGRVESARCSVIGHVFRQGGSISQDTTDSNVASPTLQIYRNKLRTMLLWMDEGGALTYLLLGQPTSQSLEDLGGQNLLDAYQWRKTNLKMDFSQYMEQVYPDSTFRGPQDVPFAGRLRNVGSDYCLDQGKGRHLVGQRSMTLIKCLDPKVADTIHQKNMLTVRRQPAKGSLFNLMHPSSQQLFVYNQRLRWIHPGTNDEACVGNGQRADFTVSCNGSPQTWTVDYISPAQRKRLVLPTLADKKYVRLINDQNGLCLTSPAAGSEPQGQVSIPVLRDCSLENKYQIWTWDAYQTPQGFLELRKEMGL
ncbi:MAG: uncharacterized protein KVP18_003747 [Porospora cf. gigantea A]|uniref:uncharacterized protein n=2 Tax=Porospora cf. gigantea A TaxID=2853593 RepID=UPI00355A1C3F|nr:MAG: hypothetical protein KVP18_003747 [Porospora cf. gigantea A]